MVRMLRTLVALALAVVAVSAQEPPAIDAVTRAALANRVEGRHTVGIEVGLATREGRTYAGQGAVAKGGAQPTKDTVFEIGSITKVFTALLLADMIERQEVALDDPVSKPSILGDGAEPERPCDHACGSDDAHVRAAEDPVEHGRDESGQPVCRLRH